MSTARAAAQFEAHRPFLKRLAARLLGSRADADDVVQDAYLRWHRVAAAQTVETPRAYLVRIVTRLCLDRMRALRRQRLAYDGPWLPEPELEPEQDLTLTLLLALERLSPLERAAFLLHDVFGTPFADLAVTLKRSEAACRQLAARARAHIQAAQPRYPVDAREAEAITEAFFKASHLGDMAALTQLLAPDAVLLADGGGVRLAVRNPILGRDKVARFFAGLARKRGPSAPNRPHLGPINGLPGYVTLESDGLPQSTAFKIENGQIAAIYIVRNPHKLQMMKFLPLSR